jgi:hypothetical protein
VVPLASHQDRIEKADNVHRQADRPGVGVHATIEATVDDIVVLGEADDVRRVDGCEDVVVRLGLSNVLAEKDRDDGI